MNKVKVRFCPFCGHHGQTMGTSTYEGIRREDEGSPCEKVVRTLYFVECRCCGARGPTEYEPRFAVDSWNGIHSSTAHGDDPLEVELDLND